MNGRERLQWEQMTSFVWKTHDEGVGEDWGLGMGVGEMGTCVEITVWLDQYRYKINVLCTALGETTLSQGISTFNQHLLKLRIKYRTL